MSRIRDQLAAKRLEARSSRASSPASSPARSTFSRASRSTIPDSRLDDKTPEAQVRKAARSAKLDLGSLNLAAIPPIVYTDLLHLDESDLSRPPPKPAPVPTAIGTPRRGAASSSGGGGGSGVAGMFGAMSIADDEEGSAEAMARAFGTPVKRAPPPDPEELVSFRAPDNRILELELEIGLFGGLKTLDLRQNQLGALPDAVADLLRLQWIDVSHNALVAFPPALLLLPELESANLSNNAIKALDFTRPVEPSEEGLSYGTGFLITSFERKALGPKGILPALRNLNLADNAITTTALEGFRENGAPLKLRVLTLSNNNLSGILDAEKVGFDAARLPELTNLVLSNNASLASITGELAPGVSVDTQGCFIAGSPARADAGATSTNGANGANGANSSANGSPKYVPTPGGPTDVPMASATFTFITHPAVSFEAEPLPVEMDVYLPPASASTAPHPVVIWWHGGGLLQGNKENLPPHLRRLPSRALGPKGEHAIVVSPNYRLAPQAPILDILADVNSAITFVRGRLNDRLASKGLAARADAERIVLSGGSAGGYLALMAGLPVPARVADAEIGGYRAPAGWAPRGVAPFYPITDLAHAFWAAKTDPVPWWPSGSVPDAAAQPHLNPKAPPVATAVSGGPRSILYPYMLQHALFPFLLFQNQRSRGRGLDGFRPDPTSLSVTTRLALLARTRTPHPPVYLVYGTTDDKVQPLEDTVALLRSTPGDAQVDVLDGADHAFDEDPVEQCAAFVVWLEKTLF